MKRKRLVWSRSRTRSRSRKRRGCAVLALARSSQRYLSVREPCTELRDADQEVGGGAGHVGLPAPARPVGAGGWAANAKKVYRLYREEGLSMRAKRPRRHRAALLRQMTTT